MDKVERAHVRGATTRDADALSFSLKGEAKIIASQHYRSYPDTTVRDVVLKLRKHFIPNEAQHSMEKINELWALKKSHGESTSVFITRFDKAMGSVRLRGIELDDKLVFTQCINAMSPEPALMATIVAQCPQQSYQELRNFMLSYAAVAEKPKKLTPREKVRAANR